MTKLDSSEIAVRVDELDAVRGTNTPECREMARLFAAALTENLSDDMLTDYYAQETARQLVKQITADASINQAEALKAVRRAFLDTAAEVVEVNDSHEKMMRRLTYMWASYVSRRVDRMLLAARTDWQGSVWDSSTT